MWRMAPIRSVFDLWALCQYHLNNTVNFDCRNATFIIKASLDSEELADMIEEYDVFVREAAIYNTVMPQVDRLLGNIGHKNKLAPR